MRQNLNNKGFTLLELMIGLIVFTLIGAGLTTVFVSGLKFYSEEKSQVENQFSITEVSTLFDKDIRQTISATKSLNCLNLIGVSSTIQYCINTSSKTLSRNTSVIARGINTFTVVIQGNQIKITLKTDPDLRLTENTLTLEYFLREGNY